MLPEKWESVDYVFATILTAMLVAGAFFVSCEIEKEREEDDLVRQCARECDPRGVGVDVTVRTGACYCDTTVEAPE